MLRAIGRGAVAAEAVARATSRSLTEAKAELDRLGRLQLAREANRGGALRLWELTPDGLRSLASLDEARAAR